MAKSAAQKLDDSLFRETLRGTVAKLYTSNPKFSAGLFDTGQRQSGSIRFTAATQLVEGVRLVLSGQWVKDPKFGAQFAAETVEYDMSIDPEGLALWLAKNPALKGIGRAKAERIAEVFGADFDNIVTNEPEKIQKLAHLSNESMTLLTALWKDYRDYHKLITWLAQFGLSIKEIDAIKEKYGNDAIVILQADPYTICGEIPRFGFKTVDTIALKMGVSKELDSRIGHGVLWSLNENLNEGSTYMRRDDLVNAANSLLNLDTLNSKQIISDKITELTKQGHLQQHIVDKTRIVIHPDVAEKEEFLCEIFRNTKDRKHPHAHAIPADITAWLPSGDRELNEQQRQAVDQATRKSVSLISGGAGTGKTFTIKTIVDCYEQHAEKTIFIPELDGSETADKIHFRVELCAPTGKAARRMEESTGHYAQTIHRLLEYHPAFGFQRDKYNPINADVVIIDEFSMVDSILGYHLFQAIDLRNTSVVIVGDHNQLPPVGPGNILRDLIQSGCVPTTMLTHVVRQAGTLKRNCTAILDGYVEPTCKPKEKGAIPWQVVRSLTETLTCKRHLVDGFKQILESRPTADIIHGIQILSPQKKGDLGCDALNVELQRVVQKVKWGVDVEPVSHGKGKRPAFYVNDKVIQTKNDYNLDVMNGTLGQIVGIGPFFDPETREEIANTKDALKIQFEGRNRPVIVEKDKRINVSLAYALTIHKCQGSEFPMVLLVIHKAHNFMHTRNLLYTGATRAKKKLIVMGDKWGISNCASKVAVDLRKTWLSELLKRCA